MSETTESPEFLDLVNRALCHRQISKTEAYVVLHEAPNDLKKAERVIAWIEAEHREIQAENLRAMASGK